MAEQDRVAAPACASVPAFVRALAFADLPSSVVSQAKRCLLDLIGVAAAGSRTSAAAIVSTYASTQMRGDRDARILFDGRRAGLAGAAFAGASTIDAIDAHDGHPSTKGHAGVAVLPALLAYLDGGAARAIDAREFLTCLVLGYEIATRAGIALHASVDDYHCSGAWNSLACAALGARLFGFDDERTRHALGIAEYLGPRGQILRVCDSPSMLKDGSGWGAHAGVSAAMLARAGFTGAPAITVERSGVRELWSDLGSRWRILEQYFKPYPVCRWAQPAVEAALALQRAHGFTASEVASLAIDSFGEAIALGSQCPSPSTTEDAQYSLPFAVAAALVFGRLGPAEIDAPRIADARVARLLRAMTLHEESAFSERFPDERWARVRVTLIDGRTLASEPAQARGNPDHPLGDAELRGKYHELAGPALGRERSALLEQCVDDLERDPAALKRLVENLLSCID